MTGNLDLTRVQGATESLASAVESEDIGNIVHALGLLSREAARSLPDDLEGDLDSDEIALAFELSKGTRGILESVYAAGLDGSYLLCALRAGGRHEEAAALSGPWKRAAQAVIDANRSVS
jgi:hypothetical protein